MPSIDAVRATIVQHRERLQAGPSFLAVWLGLVEQHNLYLSMGIPKEEILGALDHGISVVLGNALARFIASPDSDFEFPLKYDEIINIALIKLKNDRPNLLTAEEIRMVSVRLLNLINSMNIEGSEQLHQAFNQSLKEIADSFVTEGLEMGLQFTPNETNEVSLRIRAQKSTVKPE